MNYISAFFIDHIDITVYEHNITTFQELLNKRMKRFLIKRNVIKTKTTHDSTQANLTRKVLRIYSFPNTQLHFLPV